MKRHLEELQEALVKCDKLVSTLRDDTASADRGVASGHDMVTIEYETSNETTLVRDRETMPRLALAFLSLIEIDVSVEFGDDTSVDVLFTALGYKERVTPADTRYAPVEWPDRGMGRCHSSVFAYGYDGRRTWHYYVAHQGEPDCDRRTLAMWRDDYGIGDTTGLVTIGYEIPAQYGVAHETETMPALAIRFLRDISPTIDLGLIRDRAHSYCSFSFLRYTFEATPADINYAPEEWERKGSGRWHNEIFNVYSAGAKAWLYYCAHQGERDCRPNTLKLIENESGDEEEEETTTRNGMEEAHAVTVDLKYWAYHPSGNTSRNAEETMPLIAVYFLNLVDPMLHIPFPSRNFEVTALKYSSLRDVAKSASSTSYPCDAWEKQGNGFCHNAVFRANLFLRDAWEYYTKHYSEPGCNKKTLELLEKKEHARDKTITMALAYRANHPSGETFRKVKESMPLIAIYFVALVKPTLRVPFPKRDYDVAALPYSSLTNFAKWASSADYPCDAWEKQGDGYFHDAIFYEHPFGRDAWAYYVEHYGEPDCDAKTLELYNQVESADD